MNETVYDILILGAGPGGLSAALTARARGRRVMLLSNPAETSSLWKAHRIDNYPGTVGMSGAEILEKMTVEVKSLGIPTVTGRVTGIMPFGKQFMVSVGTDVYTAAALILSCLDDGLYPSWDAANMLSVRLAEKLGYEFSREYVCYAME